MNFDEGIRKAARAFYDGKGFSAHEASTGKPVKHSLAMLTKIEDSVKPQEAKAPKVKKSTPKGFVNNG